MSKKIISLLITLSFLVGPVCINIFPEYKNWVIAGLEFISELWLLTELILLNFTSPKRDIKLNLKLISFAIFFLFVADTLNSFKMIQFSSKYILISDCIYSVFAIFLLSFLIARFDIFNTKLKEWLGIFLVAFTVDSVLSYYSLLSPYLASTAPFIWKMSGSFYMILTIIVFSLIISFAARVLNRKIFWFLNFLILLFTSDFAIRYQDAFVDTNAFSWAEIGWYSAFLGLAWLLRISKNKDIFFVKESFTLAPFVSTRNLLTFSICLANTLFLIGIVFFKFSSIKNAIDITSILLMLYLFWTIANEFSIWLANDLICALSQMFKSKKNSTEKGIVEFKLERVITKNRIFEITKILEAYNDLTLHTNDMLQLTNENNKKIATAEIASQVSHDIRSPLAALNMAVSTLSHIPEETRVLIRSSISRIKDIANTLLQKNMKAPIEKENLSPIPLKTENTIQLLSCLIDTVVSEKRMQFRSKLGVEIDFILNEDLYGVFANVDASEFMRVMSNLINNAVEAFKNDIGQVIVSLISEKDYSVISITDNGCGIPQEMLKLLGQPGATFDKEAGSGLGLYHAMKTINSWGGYLNIDSTLDSGTAVKVALPLAEPAWWFVDTLCVSKQSKVIIVDDDISIHQIWRDRFEKANFHEAGVKVLHFSTPEQLLAWDNHNIDHTANTIFLIDYEFIGCNQVGLDVIEKLEIQSKAILTTSHYNELNVQKRCKNLGVRLLPKDMAMFVPICFKIVNKVDIIPIDDDPLVTLQ